MEAIAVKDDVTSYQIVLTNDVRTALSSFVAERKYAQVGVLTDKTVCELWGTEITRYVQPNYTIVVPAGEQHKSLKTVQSIWKSLAKNKCDKSDLIVIIGGGVIGDMGGFAAATYLRGIDFVHIPTTLISQVDSSIGGKTAINYLGAKNIIGLFAQPQRVFVDTAFLNTLNTSDLVSGFAEMIKHGLIADSKYFGAVTAKPPNEFNNQELQKLVHDSIRIKCSIINGDLQQHNRRKLVLFGHTIGQAIEAISLESTSPLKHGEAISIGMIAEAYISSKLFSVKQSDIQMLEQRLLQAGLPIRTHFDIQAIRKKLAFDKKIVNGEISWSLLESIGKGNFDVSVSDELISEALVVVTKY